MICQRCGVCCVTMPVFIHVGGRVKMKPHDLACPYLSRSGVSTCCSEHDKPWYEGSPCHTYGNSNVDPDFANRRGRPCPVGEFVKQKGGLKTHSPDLEWAKAEELEDLGEWPREEAVQGRGSDGDRGDENCQGDGVEDEQAPP